MLARASACLALLLTAAPAADSGSAAEDRQAADHAAPPTPPWAELAPRARHTFSGLQYVVLKEGAGPKPAAGRSVDVHYVGRLRDGSVYFSSYARGSFFRFNAGTGFVVKGFDEMILDMRKGERRVVVIPPELGYGRQGVPGEVPPRETLTIDMELLDF